MFHFYSYHSGQTQCFSSCKTWSDDRVIHPHYQDHALTFCHLCANPAVSRSLHEVLFTQILNLPDCFTFILTFLAFTIYFTVSYVWINLCRVHISQCRVGHLIHHVLFASSTVETRVFVHLLQHLLCKSLEPCLISSYFEILWNSLLFHLLSRWSHSPSIVCPLWAFPSRHAAPALTLCSPLHKTHRHHFWVHFLYIYSAWFSQFPFLKNGFLIEHSSITESFQQPRPLLV